MYQLTLQQFTGPIEKLLELIEEKKLPVAELSLAEVTADFLNYLKTIKEVEPRILADFVVVASRLLLIKSKSLLPNLELTEEEERGIKDLEERLRRYQAFKPAINLFKKTWEQKGYSVSRPLFHGRPPVFYPPKDLDVKILHSAVNSIFETLKQLSPEVQTIELSAISLEEKIKEIIKRLESGIQQFGKLTKEKSRSEVIVLFIALLHLLRDQIIKAEQKQGFSDIIIEKHGSSK
ncbi:MAG: segregation/condensation protein A [Candidatus Paceibacterota bacterium]